MSNGGLLLMVACAWAGYLLGRKYLSRHLDNKTGEPHPCPPHQWEKVDGKLRCKRCPAKPYGA